MIFQWRDGRVLAIAQPDHARLAGAMAEAWGNERAFRPEPWKPVEVATARHDDGWSEWEKAPTLRTDGTPTDFITISMEDRIEIFERCVDLIDDDRHAAVLVSMHVIGLFLGRMEPKRNKMIDNLQGEMRKKADDFIASQHAWQKQAMEGLDLKNLMLQYRLLETFDRLSLAFCMQPLERISNLVFDYVPLEPGNPVSKITLNVTDGRIVLDPYPFREDQLEMSVEGSLLDGANFEDVESFRKALSDAPIDQINLRFARS